MEIPKSLEECKRENIVASRVKFWAEWFELWGSRLLVVLLVIGVISTIITATKIAQVDEDMVFITFVTSLITWVLYSIIEYVVYNFISMLLYALSAIVQSVVTSANVELYKASKAEKNVKDVEEMVKEPEKSEHKWLCNSCGKLISKSPCPYCGYKDEK